jgi:hypothetical protein
MNEDTMPAADHDTVAPAQEPMGLQQTPSIEAITLPGLRQVLRTKNIDYTEVSTALKINNKRFYRLAQCRGCAEPWEIRALMEYLQVDLATLQTAPDGTTGTSRGKRGGSPRMQPRLVIAAAKREDASEDRLATPQHPGRLSMQISFADGRTLSFEHTQVLTVRDIVRAAEALALFAFDA